MGEVGGAGSGKRDAIVDLFLRGREGGVFFLSKLMILITHPPPARTWLVRIDFFVLGCHVVPFFLSRDVCHLLSALGLSLSRSNLVSVCHPSHIGML